MHPLTYVTISSSQPMTQSLYSLRSFIRENPSSQQGKMMNEFYSYNLGGSTAAIRAGELPEMHIFVRDEKQSQPRY